MSKRPDVRLVLDIRSDETVVVLADPESTFRYDPSWQRPLTFEEVYVDRGTVVVIDRMELSRESLDSILAAGPRIVAIASADFEQERRIVKTIRSLHPWSDIWELSSDFGRLLVTTAFGRPYDRSTVPA